MTNTTTQASNQAPGFHRFPVRDFEAVALHDGVLVRDRPSGFVRNADDATVGEAFAEIGMARDRLTLTFNPLALRTGSGIVLIDTGFGAGGPPGTGQMTANLAAAGIRPEEVTTVLISHFHGDHISGLRGPDGALAFPNAEIAVPEPEWAYWMDEARMAAAPDGLKPNFALVRKMLGDGPVRRFGWGEAVLPGIRAEQADGHTPGQTAFEIGTGEGALMYVADITNNPLLFARHPEWQLMFDMDAERAVVTRRRLLDRAAAEHLRLHFFHAPFPSNGYVLKSGGGYEFAPALWTATAG